MSDELIELYVELEDIGRRIAAMKRTVAAQIGRHEVTVQKILDAVRDSDEAVASMGQDCGALRPRIAEQVLANPNWPTPEEALARQRRCGGICTDGDEPPSRTL